MISYRIILLGDDRKVEKLRQTSGVLEFPVLITYDYQLSYVYHNILRLL